MEEERRNEYEAGRRRKACLRGKGSAHHLHCTGGTGTYLHGIIIFVTVKNISSISSSQPELPQDFYDYGSNYGYDLYTPDADDEYYEELTDATTDGLSYQVEWHQETAYPDNSDENAYLSLYYPTFSGDHEELLESINGKVREMIHRYDGSYTEDGLW